MYNTCLLGHITKRLLEEDKTVAKNWKQTVVYTQSHVLLDNTRK